MSSFSVTWFDALVIIMVGTGLFVGKKRGMSNELLDLMCWLMMVVVSALYYEPSGKLLSNATSMSLYWSNIICYLFIALVIKFAFSYIKRAVGEKLVGSDIFGRGEFYLGALAGGLRFFCMVIMLVAIMNAKFITKAMVQAQIKAQEAEYGSSFFPTYAKIQSDVLFDSTSGQFFRERLEEQLIKPVDPYATAVPKKPVGNKQREKAVWDATGEKGEKGGEKAVEKAK
ncbi:MAG TPA: CvpA family protein [Verrucomicrobiae bacterium]